MSSAPIQPTEQPASRARKTVRDMVSLPRYGYILDYLYFPTPTTGIKGHRFKLFLESQSLPQPNFVKFKVE